MVMLGLSIRIDSKPVVYRIRTGGNKSTINNFFIPDFMASTPESDYLVAKTFPGFIIPVGSNTSLMLFCSCKERLPTALSR
jgi:hypothetical protein